MQISWRNYSKSVWTEFHSSLQTRKNGSGRYSSSKRNLLRTPPGLHGVTVAKNVGVEDPVTNSKYCLRIPQNEAR